MSRSLVKPFPWIPFREQEKLIVIVHSLHSDRNVDVAHVVVAVGHPVTAANMARPAPLTARMLWLWLAAAAAVAEAKCPRKCSCIWRDAKITVDCSNKGLAGIPSNVDPSTQVLIMGRAFL